MQDGDTRCKLVTRQERGGISRSSHIIIIIILTGYEPGYFQLQIFFRNIIKLADHYPPEELRPLPTRERQSRRLRELPPNSPLKQDPPQKRSPPPIIRKMNEQNQLYDVRR